MNNIDLVNTVCNEFAQKISDIIFEDYFEKVSLMGSINRPKPKERI